jgi:hydrogenase/urease accessory protein HupE
MARYTSMRRLVAWIIAALGATAAPLLAHPAPFSYLDVRLDGRALEVTVVVHVLDVAHELGVPERPLLEPAGLAPHVAALTALVQTRLQLIADGRAVGAGAWSPPEPVADRDGLRLRVRYALPEPPGQLAIAAHLFPYDPQHQTFVNLYEQGTLTTQAILGSDRPSLVYYTGTRQGVVAVVRKFAASGVHHILIGPDHLLFLVGLLLVGGSIRRLALVVSAFTLAHSITLTLAALRIVSPPAWIVEPAIALSIVYVGADNLTVRGGRDVRGWIAFAFGLIHGFGFANVLREMDLPARALGWSLFSFNVGVEIGRLLVVVAVASALAAVRARSEAAGRRLAFVGSIAVIAAGTFWFIERVFFSAGAA